MAISNELLSSTLYSIRDGEVDELFQKVPFLDHAKKKGGIEYEDGGIKIQRPLALTEHSTITQHSTGYEPVSLAVSDVMQPAIYDWSDFTAPIVITKKEEYENSGEKAIVKILEARTRSVMGQLRRELNKQIISGRSTVLTEVLSLNGTDADGDTGFLETEARGSQDNVVGGISKATYSATPGWQNSFGDIAGDFSANGILVMQQVYQEANVRAPMGEIGLVLLSESAFANYRRALFAQERYVDQTMLDGGRMGLAFGGAMVEQDLELGFTSLADATDPVSGYMINFDGVKLVIHRDADFAMSPFETVQGTSARAAYLYHKCQLIADHLGSQAVLNDGEVW